MEEKGLDMVIAPASQADCRLIARLMLERRIDEPHFQRLARSRLQRMLYERWAAPRFLSRDADTFRATVGGELAGFLVLLYEHPAVVIVDMAALEPFKGQFLERHLLAHAAQVAAQREYPYLRAALAAGDAYVAERFQEAGFQPLDFRRWEFSGTVRAREIPPGITMQPLAGRALLDRRRHYLQMELDAAQPAGRELIEAYYLPRRPPLSQAFEVLHEGEPFGYLAVQRERGTYVLNLSTLPEWWAGDLEVALVTAFPVLAARAEQASVRLIPDTTPHADALAGALTALGLLRRLSEPDIWFKALGREDPQAG
ncbi:MAG: hypothetical protein QHJ81_07425 [Anaerolineae bacterium]|nr:hypothetical protein [Anaerolineae bacterium]